MTLSLNTIAYHYDFSLNSERTSCVYHCDSVRLEKHVVKIAELSHCPSIYEQIRFDVCRYKIKFIVVFVVFSVFHIPIIRCH